MALPADSHVHSEWSWDTGGPVAPATGRMRQTCERALRIGLPAVIFTEHFDFDDAWRVAPEDLPEQNRPYISPAGYLAPLGLTSTATSTASTGAATTSRTSTS